MFLPYIETFLSVTSFLSLGDLTPFQGPASWRSEVLNVGCNPHAQSPPLPKDSDSVVGRRGADK